MAIPAQAWSESSPSGSDAVSGGDDAIRLMKTQVREVIDVDHKFDSSGSGTTWGYHDKATFITAASVQSEVADAAIICAVDVGGKAELFAVDEDSNSIQLTTAGKIGGTLTDIDCNDLIADTIKIDANNVYIKSKDAAGTGTVDLIKASTGDKAMLPDGSLMATSGAPTVDAGISNKKYVDDRIAAIPAQVGFGEYESKSNNTVYEALTDGFVICQASGVTHTLNIYVDTFNPPTTSRADSGGLQSGESEVITMPVKKGNFWKSVSSTGSTPTWISLGS